MIRKLTRILAVPVVILAGSFAASIASAGVIMFMTPTGSMTSGGPVSASATFTTSANDLMITLTNLQANPTDVAQALSGLDFTISGFTTGTLNSSSGTEVTIDGSGIPSLGSSVDTGWALVSGPELCVICSSAKTVGPTHLIIGPPAGDGNYDAANGSIAGNKPHNPFLSESATFDIGIMGLTAEDTISSVLFRFGTTYGEDTVTGQVPEPGTLALLGVGLAALGFAGIGRRRRSTRSI